MSDFRKAVEDRAAGGWYGLRNLRYWLGRSRPNIGPTKGAVIYRDKVVEINLAAHEGYQQLRDLPSLDVEYPIGTATYSETNTSRGWSGEYPGAQGGTRWVQADTLGEVVELVRDGFEKEIDREVEVLSDPVKQLERALKKQDWYGHMSDDPRYWRSSDQGMDEIKDLLTKVDPDTARELWNKYAPEDYIYPTEER